MTNVDLSRAEWRKSSYSSANGQCTEVTPTAGGFAIRDSKNPDGGHLVVSAANWRTFLNATRGDRES